MEKWKILKPILGFLPPGLDNTRDNIWSQFFYGSGSYELSTVSFG
jgi:hypothetical protein